MDWWVTEAGNSPIGPVTTELILRGIDAGKVPLEALVCEVGGKSWRSLAEVEPFANAVAGKRRTRRFDESAERTIVDEELSLPEAGPLPERGLLPEGAEEPVLLRRFDATSERTVVDLGGVAPEPALVRIERTDEGEDRTIVESQHRQTDPP